MFILGQSRDILQIVDSRRLRCGPVYCVGVGGRVMPGAAATGIQLSISFDLAPL